MCHTVTTQNTTDFSVINMDAWATTAWTVGWIDWRKVKTQNTWKLILIFTLLVSCQWLQRWISYHLCPWKNYLHRVHYTSRLKWFGSCKLLSHPFFCIVNFMAMIKLLSMYHNHHFGSLCFWPLISSIFKQWLMQETPTPKYNSWEGTLKDSSVS